MLLGWNEARDERGRAMRVTVSSGTVKARRREHLAAVRERRTAAALHRASNPAEHRSKFAEIAKYPMYAVLALAAGAAALAFFAVCFAAVCLPLVGASMWLSWPPQAGVGATVVLLFIAIAVLSVRGRKTSNDRTARELVRLGLCGTCGYALEGLEPAPDACIECPECGSAWKPADNRGCECPGCGEQIDTLAVVEFGRAECPYCDTKFEFREQSAPPREANETPQPS